MTNKTHDDYLTERDKAMSDDSDDWLYAPDRDEEYIVPPRILTVECQQDFKTPEENERGPLLAPSHEKG